MVRCSLLLPLLAAASAVQGKLRAPETVKGAYIVELQEGEDASAFHAHVNSHASTRMNLSYALFNGASIQFNDLETAEDQAAIMAQLSCVKAMYPVKTYKKPEPEVIWTGDQGRTFIDLKRRQEGPDTFSTHEMTQVSKLRADGITGKGIKIAVVDTGVDYLHPALGGCFGPGCLVSFGTDLVGNAYDGSNTPVPGDDPMDCAGHGTHVSGIIAAQSNNPYGFTGTAPDVTLGMYKVFGCEGSAANDVLIAAFHLAYESGADIITASIGGDSGWTEEPWAAAVTKIVEAGVPCTVAAGNNGADGMFQASTAACGKRVTAVASFDNTISPSLGITSSYTVAGGEVQNFTYTYGTPDAWAGVNLPLWAVSHDPDSTEALGCDPYPQDTPDLSGKIVLVKRGVCTFVQKAQNAAAKGAKYIMLYNNVAGISAVDVSSVPEILAVGMTFTDVGVEWVKAMSAGSSVTLKMADPKTSEFLLSEAANNASGGYVSTYSSWGPTWDAYLKPQYGAVGGNVLSTYPRALGSYAVLSGTSMATPQAGAIIALIAQVRKTRDPAVIESLLAIHSTPVMFNDGTTTSNLLAPVPQQGAGLVRAYDAAYSPVYLSHSSLSFNDTDNFIPEMNFTIKNVGSEDITFELGNAAAATAYTFDATDLVDLAAFPNNMTNEYATIAFSDSKVTVPANGEATVLVTPTPPAGLDAQRLPVWSGYITLKGSDGSNLSLPYQGIFGSMRSHETFVQPFISTSASVAAGAYEEVSANHTFVLPSPDAANTTDANLPSVVVPMTFGSWMVTAKFVPLFSSKAAVGLNYTLFTENAVDRGVFGVSWDGSLSKGFAPAGTYKVTVKALRALGDPSKPEDYDVLDTPPFTIVYEGANTTAPTRRWNH